MELLIQMMEPSLDDVIILQNQILELAHSINHNLNSPYCKANKDLLEEQLS